MENVGEKSFLIVGLGNPELKYENTRHNIGQWLLDSIAKEKSVSLKEEKKFLAKVAFFKEGFSQYILAFPLTYMNESGRAVSKIASFYKVKQENIIVLCDELNMPLSSSKLCQKLKIGSHNGLKSIKTFYNEFLQFKIGIGQKPHKEMPLSSYVLSKFSKEEKELLLSQKNRLINEVFSIAELGCEKAMNFINTNK